MVEIWLSDHETFRREHKQLLIAQVLQKEQIEDLLRVITQEHSKQIPALNQRVDNLVSAIGEFIGRLPAPRAGDSVAVPSEFG